MNTFRARNGNYGTPVSTRKQPNLKNNEADFSGVSEWKLGLFGLIFSLIVITCKVFYANRT